MNLSVERVNCPGCGAPLPLASSAGRIVQCPYCGADSKIIRRLRRIEPDPQQVVRPAKQGDKAKSYDTWTSGELVNGLITEEEPQKRMSLAVALDSWKHVNIGTARLVPAIVEVMLEAPAELDAACSGILGKLICSDEIELRRAVIEAGERYGFRLDGSFGLLDALGLGDAGTLKLLLDIAEWADCKLATEYAQAALVAAGHAINRDGERRNICIDILLYRLLYVSPIVQKWILEFLKRHFDVGYSYGHREIIELIEDCASENPDLIGPLCEAIGKGRDTDDCDEYLSRLTQIDSLKTVEARCAAEKYLGRAPDSCAGRYGHCAENQRGNSVCDMDEQDGK